MVAPSWNDCLCQCHNAPMGAGFRGAHCEKCDPTPKPVEAAKSVDAVKAVEVVKTVEAVQAVDFTKLSIKAEDNPILDHARAILAGKPPRSYVESALALAQYILDHQLSLAGWMCSNCKVFNGEEKQIINECRACETMRPITQTTFPRRIDHVG
jgi:hypothetical protein